MELVKTIIDHNRTLYVCRCPRCSIQGNPSPHPCEKWHHVCMWRDPKLPAIATRLPCNYRGLGDVVAAVIGQVVALCKIVATGARLKTLFDVNCGGCSRRRAWLNRAVPLHRWPLKALEPHLCPVLPHDLRSPRILIVVRQHGSAAAAIYREVFAALARHRPDWRIDVVCCTAGLDAYRPYVKFMYRADGVGARPNPIRYAAVWRMPTCRKCGDPAATILKDFFGIEP